MIWRMETKICTLCQIEKPLTAFHRSHRKHQARCSACRNQRAKRVYASGDTVKIQARIRHLYRAYGLSLEQFDELFYRQAGRCGCCGDDLRPGRAMHLDHDHSSGMVRAILCHACNVGLGYFEAPDSRVVAIGAYLSAWRSTDPPE